MFAFCIGKDQDNRNLPWSRNARTPQDLGGVVLIRHLIVLAVANSALGKSWVHAQFPAIWLLPNWIVHWSPPR